MSVIDISEGTLDRVIEIEGTDYFTVDLYPYKIRNRELFYDRNHKKNLSPFSETYKNYWDGHLRKSIEGHWILDKKDKNDEGVWIYMFPKLYFYINTMKIVDLKRNRINPVLRDNELIMSSYYFIIDGFSGFELDDLYTCNFLVKKFEHGDEFAMHEQDEFDNLKSIRKKDGTLKQYIDPWIYLTEHYLITHNQKKPLGLPLYENPRQNGMFLAARAIGKSFFTFMSDFMHEWLLNGIRRWEDRGKINNDMLFAIASQKEKPLKRTLNNISRAYTELEGKYDKMPTYGGAFFKKVRGGAWEPGNTISHEVKKKNGANEITGNSVQLMTITSNDTTLVSGDRFRRIYIEETGFVKYIKEIYSACEDSLRKGEEVAGSFIAIGTGGDTDNIEGSKDMYESPGGYHIAAIRNYFERSGKLSKRGLFIPYTYAFEKYKDANGNTDLKNSLLNILSKRIKIKKEKDNDGFVTHCMFNPIYPKEMLIPKSRNKFPALEMSQHLAELKSDDDIKKAMVGSLRTDASEVRGVAFDIDFKDELEPILRFGNEDKLSTKEGAFVMYEDVIDNPPPGLYTILFDPVAQSGTGSSLNSALVYKADYNGNDEMMKDDIVADWTGRHEMIDDTYEMMIKMAKYYNATIFVERNVIGFLEWCRANDYYHYLFDEPIKTLQLVQRGNVTNSWWGKGVKMNKSLNTHAYIKLANWFRTPIKYDKDGLVIKKKLHCIRTQRLLAEGVLFDIDLKTQFDGISTLFLLMILKTELEGQDLEINLDEEEDPYSEYSEAELNQPENRTIDFLNSY